MNDLSEYNSLFTITVNDMIYTIDSIQSSGSSMTVFLADWKDFAALKGQYRQELAEFLSRIMPQMTGAPGLGMDLMIWDQNSQRMVHLKTGGFG